MRSINLIIIHCSATPEGKDFTVSDIDRWHKARGFNNHGIHIGYHYVIYRDGSIHQGRPVSMIGAHCAGHNAHSIGICYIGGMSADSSTPADTRTPAQKQSLLSLLSNLKQRFPSTQILGHHDLNPHKSCPCFDARTEYSKL